MGIELFCEMSKKKRNYLLSKVPSDELTCFFMGFNEDDIYQCFSKEAIQDAFSQLPISDTLLLLSYIKVENIHYFIPKSEINPRIDCIRNHIFIEELYNHSDLLFTLIDNHLIRKELVLSKLFHPYSILSDINHLFHTNPKFKKLGHHPLVYQFKLPKDISYYLFSFL